MFGSSLTVAFPNLAEIELTFFNLAPPSLERQGAY